MMIVDIEESRHGPSDAMHNPSQPFEFLSKETCGSLLQPPITKTKSAQIESSAVEIYSINIIRNMSKYTWWTPQSSQMEILLEPTSNKLLVGLDDSVAASFQRSRIHKPHAHTQAFKHKLIKEVNEVNSVRGDDEDNDLKNSKSKDKGSKSRSQSMDEQSHYKQDKTITRQSINVKRHVFNVIGDTEKFEERDLNIGGDC
ncbi:hypothetical protein Tco_0726147 [Tanacetum coccineum]|uniref:Uncharacterized protein n=1 Tax=Tanacetum coccineum TaxID=301880 RepID=A0ABQ4YFQ2_9ASTR